MGVRTTVYIPDHLYDWWVDEAPDLVLSDFVREGLREARASRSGECAHQVARCQSCGLEVGEVATGYAPDPSSEGGGVSTG